MDKLEKMCDWLKSEKGISEIDMTDLIDMMPEYEKWEEENSTPDVADSAVILIECMIGRDAECNHPKCPVTDEDAKNGKHCTLPLFDYRQ